MTRRLKWISGLLVANLALASCDRAAEPVAVAATGLSCAPRADGAANLDAEWQSFAAQVDECVLRGADGAVALRITTVSAERLYAGQPDGATTVTLPKPRILSADGKAIGRLPYNYPDDPPFSTKLDFEEWSGGLPRRIRIHVTDPTVTGDHELAMAWDESKNEYVGGEEKPSR